MIAIPEVVLFGSTYSLHDVILAALICLSFGIAGARVGRKTKNGLFGFLLGLFFGPIGLLIILCRVVGHVPPSLSEPEDPFAVPHVAGRAGPIRLRSAPRSFKMRRPA